MQRVAGAEAAFAGELLNLNCDALHVVNLNLSKTHGCALEADNLVTLLNYLASGRRLTFGGGVLSEEDLLSAFASSGGLTY
jgi:hypothetical protein